METNSTINSWQHAKKDLQINRTQHWQRRLEQIIVKLTKSSRNLMNKTQTGGLRHALRR